jgi:hypothetical protein
MKNLIIAAAMAVTSIVSFAPSSYAQGVSVTIGDGPRYHRQDDRPRYYRERPRYVREWERPRHRCVVKKVRSHRNGHLVVKTTRVCR